MVEAFSTIVSLSTERHFGETSPGYTISPVDSYRPAMISRSGGTLASRGAMSNASDETRKLWLGTDCANSTALSDFFWQGSNLSLSYLPEPAITTVHSSRETVYFLGTCPIATKRRLFWCLGLNVRTGVASFVSLHGCFVCNYPAWQCNSILSSVIMKVICLY